MRSIILSVRPAPDCDLDVAALARRGAAAMAAPLMTPTYEGKAPISERHALGGIIFTSRHAVTGLARALGDDFDPSWRSCPVFAVGRSTARAAAAAGFNDISVGAGGGAGLVPLITARADDLTGRLLWPAASDRSFDMAAALAGVVPVDMVPVYSMEPVARLPDAAVAAIEQGCVLGVILMSARSARLFRGRLAEAGQDAALAGVTMIAGSRAIADAAGDGWHRTFIARRPTRARLLAIAALLYDRRDRAV